MLDNAVSVQLIAQDFHHDSQSSLSTIVMIARRDQYAIDDGQTSASQGSLDTSHHPVTKQFIHAESNLFDSPLVKPGQQHKQSA